MFSIPQCSGANDTLTLPLLQTLLGIFTKMWSPSSLASAKPHLTIIPLILDFRISPLLFFSLQILLPLIPSLLKQFFFSYKSFLLLKYTFNWLSSSFRLHNSFSYQHSLLLLNPLIYSSLQPSTLLPNPPSTPKPSPLLPNPLLYSPTLSFTPQPSPLLSNPLLYSSTLSSTLQPSTLLSNPILALNLVDEPCISLYLYSSAKLLQPLIELKLNDPNSTVCYIRDTLIWNIAPPPLGI